MHTHLRGVHGVNIAVQITPFHAVLLQVIAIQVALFQAVLLLPVTCMMYTTKYK